MLNKGSDPMILSLPIELVAGISLIIILIVIYVAALYKSFKKYENAERDAGEVLYEIVPSKRILKLRRIDLVAGIGIFFFFYLSEFIRYQSFPPTRIEIGIVLTGAIASFYLNDKPQKICENGIVVRYGLVSWSNIKEIMPIDETDDSINIILYKRMNLGKKITLYCQPEDIMNVLHMIERKINFNPEIV